MTVGTQRNREIRIAVLLVCIAVVIYVLRVLVFGYPQEMLRYLMDDVAFLLIQVLILWLVIERVIRNIETESMMHKLNMVIGAFFAEVGMTLMGIIASFDAEFDAIRPNVLVKPSWKPEDYTRAKANLKDYDYSIELQCGDLPALKTFLLSERSFLLGLLENQNLLEHESFTELLWAVFHLLEELQARERLTGLHEADLDHLSGDIRRAYTNLLKQWVVYLQHLKSDYPYLYSLAVRNNPLNPDARVELE